MMMLYRREIDGLRSLAVVPVILFHAGIAGFSGGFVGVDVFFVISGYLITSIIIHELQAGTFTLSGFYERRVRRILPALFFVLLACLPLAWWLLLPHELMAFARSQIAAILFVSNILFWQESDYFATDSELIPLLHTWSLAVEEQYYIVFPLLLMFFWKMGLKRIAGLVAVIALASLVFSEWYWRVDAAANFYLLPSRAWELMAGAGCALYLHRYTPQHGTWNQWGSLVGLALLLLSFFWLDDSVPFPGVYALIPVLGASLIILFADANTWVGRLLALSPLVGIGLVSYSAYLWHQPLLAFARLYHIDELPLLWAWSLVGLTFVLAFISWRWVEKPFRQRDFLSRTQLFGGAFVVSMGLVLIAGVLIGFEGFAGRFE